MNKNRLIQASAAAAAAVTMLTGIYAVSIRPEPPDIDVVEQINTIMEAKTAINDARGSITEFTNTYRTKAAELRKNTEDAGTAAEKSEKAAADAAALTAVAKNIEKKLEEFNRKADEKIQAMEEEINRIDEMNSGKPPEPPEAGEAPVNPPPNSEAMPPTERLRILVTELTSFTSGTEAEEIRSLGEEGAKLAEQLKADIEEYNNSIKPTEKPKAKATAKPSSSSHNSGSSSSGSGSSSNSSSSSVSDNSSSNSGSSSVSDNSSSGGGNNKKTEYKPFSGDVKDSSPVTIEGNPAFTLGGNK